MIAHETMKAVVVGPDGPEFRDVARPVPRATEVLVRVRAAALNRSDLLVAAGHVHGRSGGAGSIVGIEWSGDVVSAGADVPPGLLPGDMVMCSGQNGYAEYAVTDWGRVYNVQPSVMSYAQAAALPIALQTAHEAIVASGQFRRGQTILIQGASSGVGLMALQIARYLGAGLVIGSSTTSERRAGLAAYGADLAIDSRSDGWVDDVLAHTGGKGVDLVIDFISAGAMNDNLRATALCGRIVNVGRLGGFSGEFDFDLHSARRIQYIGTSFRTRSHEDVRTIAAALRADLWDAVNARELQIPVDRTFALADAVAALDYMRANKHFGKIVLLNDSVE